MEKNAVSITCRCFLRLDIFFFYTDNYEKQKNSQKGDDNA